MLVVLSKQDERLSRLEYELSDLVHENDMKKQFTFDFDESENETFLKLKKMELLDYQKIVESEGLPFSFVMNMMNELQDTMNLYK